MKRFYLRKDTIVFPNRNEEFAELFGILTGDGYVGQYKLPNRIVSAIEIVGNKLKDFDYIQGFTLRIIKNLFNITPKLYVRENQNTVRLIINSKEIVNFLKEEGFPLGKKGNITPPNWIINESKFFSKYVRGIFDTDGYLTLKNKEGKKYPVIGISSISKPLLNSIKEFLNKLDISSYLGKRVVNNERYKKQLIEYKLQISGKKNIFLFFDKIGSNNKRNLLKYNEYMRIRGVEPRTPTSSA